MLDYMKLDPIYSNIRKKCEVPGSSSQTTSFCPLTNISLKVILNKYLVMRYSLHERNKTYHLSIYLYLYLFSHVCYIVLTKSPMKNENNILFFC